MGAQSFRSKVIFLSASGPCLYWVSCAAATSVNQAVAIKNGIAPTCEKVKRRKANISQTPESGMDSEPRKAYSRTIIKEIKRRKTKDAGLLCSRLTPDKNSLHRGYLVRKKL